MVFSVRISFGEDHFTKLSKNSIIEHTDSLFADGIVKDMILPRRDLNLPSANDMIRQLSVLWF